MIITGLCLVTDGPILYKMYSFHHMDIAAMEERVDLFFEEYGEAKEKSKTASFLLVAP